MAKRGYLVAFIVVLLVAGIGGFLGGRLLLQRLQSDFGLKPEAEWTPVATRTLTPPEAETVVAELPSPATTASAQTAAPTRRPTATVMVVVAPGVTPAAPTASATAGSDSAGTDVVGTLPTLPPDATVTTSTVEPTSTQASVFAFVLARGVRYSSGDCPGTYALGRVTDRNGNALPSVRLSLIDEYGNAQSAVTKTGQTDAGQYDFPMFGAPRRFYMTVVDEGGRALSERVEIFHDMPPHENQPCRWVDWRRR